MDEIRFASHPAYTRTSRARFSGPVMDRPSEMERMRRRLLIAESGLSSDDEPSGDPPPRRPVGTVSLGNRVIR